ncbi:MAG: flagellar basal-body rod protein FlgF [Desulfitobacteriaceae bacterium]
MIRGLYTGAAGMLAAQTESDIISDNVANIRTPGYKEEEGSATAFPTLLMERLGGSGGQPSQATPIGSMGTGVMVDRIVRLNTLGELQATGVGTDLALTSQGFFAVQTPQGERYTRNGRFQLGASGQLQTPDGYPVLGVQGTLGPLSSQFTVGADGTVLDQGKTVGRLRLVTLPENALQREGSSLYASSQPPQAAQAVQVKQGSIEGSGVDMAGQMVKMISVMRAYEANQKVIQTQDATLEKAVNEVGKI